MPNKDIDVNIVVTFRHTESTDALRKYSAEKLDHVARKYFQHNTAIQVILAVEKLDHICEVTVLSKGYEVIAKSVTKDLYSAIDKVVDNIERQIRKKKQKLKNHKVGQLGLESHPVSA